jgi:hypothetical protein
MCRLDRHIEKVREHLTSIYLQQGCTRKALEMSRRLDYLINIKQDFQIKIDRRIHNSRHSKRSNQDNIPNWKHQNLLRHHL